MTLIDCTRWSGGNSLQGQAYQVMSFCFSWYRHDACKTVRSSHGSQETSSLQLAQFRKCSSAIYPRPWQHAAQTLSDSLQEASGHPPDLITRRQSSHQCCRQPSAQLFQAGGGYAQQDASVVVNARLILRNALTALCCEKPSAALVLIM